MKAVKFAIVGGTGFIIDGAIFYLLMQAGLETMKARLVAFWLTATFTWLGNKHLTFQCQQQSRLYAQWAKHMLSAHCSGAANLLSFYILSWYCPLKVAFTVGILIGAVFNYWLSDRFVFTRTKEQTESENEERKAV